MQRLKRAHCPSQTWKPIFQPTVLEIFEYRDLDPCLQSVSITKPAHVGSGGHCGSSNTAETVWLLAGVPGATEVDWAPDGKVLHWADKGFQLSGRVSPSRVPVSFFQHGKKSVGLYPEMASPLINSTSGESVYPTLSQNQQSLCSGLAAEKWYLLFELCECPTYSRLAEIFYYPEIPEWPECA